MQVGGHAQLCFGAAGDDIPDRTPSLLQRETREDPRVGPARLRHPWPPATVCVAPVVVPALHVEGPEEGPVELRDAGGRHLRPAQEVHQLPQASLAVGHSGARHGGLMQPNRRKVIGVQQVGHGRVAVAIAQWGLVLSVLSVAAGQAKLAQARLTELLHDAAARVLPRQHVLHDAAEPLLVLLAGRAAHQPRQRQQHPHPLLLQPVGPAPLRVALHRDADGCDGAAQKHGTVSQGVCQQVHGPSVALVVGPARAVGVLREVIRPAGQQLVSHDGVGAESGPVGSAQVREAARHQLRIVPVGAHVRARDQRGDEDARVVVAVELDAVRLGVHIHAPGDEAEGRVRGVAAAALGHVSVAPEHKLEQLAGPLGAIVEGQHHRHLRVAVEAQQEAVRLAALRVDARGKALQDSVCTVAAPRGLAVPHRWPQVVPSHPLRHQLPHAAGAALVQQEARALAQPSQPPAQCGALRARRQGLPRVEGGQHRLQASLREDAAQPRAGVALRQQPAHDGLPEAVPGRGRAEASAEAAAGGEGAVQRVVLGVQRCAGQVRLRRREERLLEPGEAADPQQGPRGRWQGRPRAGEQDGRDPEQRPLCKGPLGQSFHLSGHQEPVGVQLPGARWHWCCTACALRAHCVNMQGKSGKTTAKQQSPQ